MILTFKAPPNGARPTTCMLVSCLSPMDRSLVKKGPVPLIFFTTPAFQGLSSESGVSVIVFPLVFYFFTVCK